MLKERVVTFLRMAATSPVTSAEIGAALSLDPQQQRHLEAALQEAESEGLVHRTPAMMYAAPERVSLAVGQIQMHPDGYAFLTPQIRPPDTAGEILIGQEALKGAQHGDLVVARLRTVARPGHLRGAEVIRILHRHWEIVVGQFDDGPAGGFVCPDDPRWTADLLVPRGQSGGARSGDKVVVRMTAWPDGRRPAVGRVVERLGRAGDADVENRGVLRAFDLPESFSGKARRQAESILAAPPPESPTRRTDLRGQLLLALGTDAAPESELAVGVQVLNGSRRKLWVCVPDVCLSIPEGSALDSEGLRRGWAVTLPGCQLPLWPEELTRGILAINPGTDRPVLACEMEIDGDGSLTRQDLYPAVIRPTARCTAAEAEALLSARRAKAGTRGRLASALRQLRALAKVVQKRRVVRGGLDLPDPWRKPASPFEQMLEELRILADEAAAAVCNQARLPIPYRVQPAPDEETAAALADIFTLLGYARPSTAGGLDARRWQQILRRAAGQPEEPLVHNVLLRALPPARYSAAASEHFGLAAPVYCHFTSPLRRYADLAVHRVLHDFWAHGGKLPDRRRRRWERYIAAMVPQLAFREQQVSEAERMAHLAGQMDGINRRVGEMFPAVVTGLSPQGLSVLLPEQLTGRVPMDRLTDDFYHFSEAEFALRGANSGRRFHLGDRVWVRLVAADVRRHSLEFALEPAEGQPTGTHSQA